MEVGSETSNCTHEQLVKHHRELSSQFQLSDKSCLIIKRVLKNSITIQLHKAQALLRRVCIDLLLSELEITLLSIYLEKLEWNCKREPLYLAGFAAKQFLSEDADLAVLRAFLNEKISSFDAVFRKWTDLVGDVLLTSLPEINARFQVLSKPLVDSLDRHIVNYNVYVDEILESADSSEEQQQICWVDSEEESEAAEILSQLKLNAFKGSPRRGKLRDPNQLLMLVSK